MVSSRWSRAHVSMTKALFVVVPVLALVVSSGTAVATHSALAIDEATGVINGAEYAMFVPPAWNGRLILYAHGFVDPDAPIALPDAAPADVAPWVVQLRETLLGARSEEHTSELQSRSDLVCRLLLEKKKNTQQPITHDSRHEQSE